MSDTTAFPTDLLYTREHEWLRREGAEVVVGITRFAADQLGDVVFVELPQPGQTLVAGQPFGVVESVKSVSDLFAPVSGTVVAINPLLQGNPEKVNDDPYGAGWMVRVQTAATLDGALLSAADYEATLS